MAKLHNESSAKINELKSNHELEKCKLMKEYSENIEKAKGDYIQKDTEITFLKGKIVELEANEKENKIQLDKKSKIISNLKEVSDNYLKKVKSQEEKISLLESKSKGGDLGYDHLGSISNGNSANGSGDSNGEVTKIKSSFDDHAFTRNILIDYFLCLYFLDTGITLKNISADLMSNMNLYFKQIF